MCRLSAYLRHLEQRDHRLPHLLPIAEPRAIQQADRVPRGALRLLDTLLIAPLLVAREEILLEHVHLQKQQQCIPQRSETCVAVLSMHTRRR